MRLHYRINKRYLTTGTRQLCEPVNAMAIFARFASFALKVKRPPFQAAPLPEIPAGRFSASSWLCVALYTLM
jgi:hypothetical protein